MVKTIGMTKFLFFYIFYNIYIVEKKKIRKNYFCSMLSQDLHDNINFNVSSTKLLIANQRVSN